METNKAPEKIYLKPLLMEDGESVVRRCTFQKQSDSQIEYTRTDAFIEKAVEWLKENKDKFLYNTGEKDEYIPTCSGKIIDEFRNYMEGEDV